MSARNGRRAIGRQHVVDREAVRLLAIEIGLRAACRKLGINENTGRSWSVREGWFRETPLPPTHNTSKTIAAATSATKPGDILLEELQKLSGQTKLRFARALVKGSKHFEQSTPTRIVRESQSLRQLVDSAATVHNWRERSQVNVATGVNFTVPDEVLERLRALKAGS